MMHVLSGTYSVADRWKAVVYLSVLVMLGLAIVLPALRFDGLERVLDFAHCAHCVAPTVHAGAGPTAGAPHDDTSCDSLSTYT